MQFKKQIKKTTERARWRALVTYVRYLKTVINIQEDLNKKGFAWIVERLPNQTLTVFSIGRFVRGKQDLILKSDFIPFDQNTATVFTRIGEHVIAAIDSVEMKTDGFEIEIPFINVKHVGTGVLHHTVAVCTVLNVRSDSALAEHTDVFNQYAYNTLIFEHYDKEDLQERFNLLEVNVIIGKSVEIANGTSKE